MQHFITIFCWDYLESIFLGRLGKDHSSHSIEDQTPLCLTGRKLSGNSKTAHWSGSKATAPSPSMPSSGPWALSSPSSSAGCGWDRAGPKTKPRESPKGWRGVAGRRPYRHLGYSATVFISGTRFFIDPPALPRVEGRSRSWIKKAFMLERGLVALISVLFSIASAGP